MSLAAAGLPASQPVTRTHTQPNRVWCCQQRDVYKSVLPAGLHVQPVKRALLNSPQHNQACYLRGLSQLLDSTSSTSWMVPPNSCLVSTCRNTHRRVSWGAATAAERPAAANTCPPDTPAHLHTHKTTATPQERLAVHARPPNIMAAFSSEMRVLPVGTSVVSLSCLNSRVQDRRMTSMLATRACECAMALSRGPPGPCVPSPRWHPAGEG